MRRLKADSWLHAKGRPLKAFTGSAFPQEEKQALMSEIKAACASMSRRVQDTTLEVTERRRAAAALSWTVQKKRLLAALLSRTHAEGYDHKRERLESMLEAAEGSRDPVESVRLLAAAMRAMWGME
jgi:hypothetical protein